MGLVREIGKSGRFLYIHEMDIPFSESLDPPVFLGGYEVRLKKGVPFEVPILEEIDIQKVTNALGRVENRQVSRIVHADEFIRWILSTEPYGECGLIALEGSTPTPGEKERSRRATVTYWFKEVERFNDTARRYNATPSPILQYWAERLGLRLESSVSFLERVECPACVQPVPKGALVCPRCSTRLYPDDVFQKLLAERQREFATKTVAAAEAAAVASAPPGGESFDVEVNDEVIDEILRNMV